MPNIVAKSSDINSTNMLQRPNTLALRSGLRWRKHIERSNSYFYKTIRTRAQNQTIHELLSSEEHLVRSPNQIIDCAKQFYEQLYSPDLIEYEALEELLIQISTSTCFDTATNNALTTEWTEEEVLACASKAPYYSSPGVDGIPYELLQLLLQHPFYIRLFTKVLNNAPQHTDNGATTRLVMDVVQRMKPPGIALLLDQEKAYDRVHPQYLQACIDKFGFPQSLVASIISLFGTTLCINVNGFLTALISQARGLRQGNSLSPLLFNLAIEPLLRFIWSSPLISGFIFLRPQQPNFTSLPRPSPPLKVLAYADNDLVFLTRPTELQTLLYLVFLYGKASNARSNRGKTLAVSLSAEDHQDWSQMLSANGITQWHNKRAYLATTYFGYPLTSSVQQMSSYLDSLILRWLTPPLLSSDQATNPDSFATSLMKYALCALSFAPSPVLPLLFPERRTTDLHKIGCFNSLFKNIDQMDFETNWTALDASSASEIPLSRICPLLLTSDPDHTCNYWKSNLVKDLCRFSTVDGKLTPITSFLSRKQRNRSEAYFDLLSLDHVKEENFFAALKSTSDLSLGLFISSMGFPHPEPKFHSLISTPLPDGTPIENLSAK
ncbi:hypothetical protein G6F62_000791 [Rhizopus arrhizus]|nr:hypothetical protein G6F62_000791 [Rhizopus arrhizus]KAG1384407.1 hypothetical protein G6F61_000471 [Rhizopus arrhizus]KAG1398537.1 hypothetical protein G6F60_008310 [Rhizopus arrhizus]